MSDLRWGWWGTSGEEGEEEGYCFSLSGELGWGNGRQTKGEVLRWGKR